MSVGIRVDAATFQTGQELRWGYFDELNGFCFMYDASGLSIVVYKDDQRFVIPSSQFTAVFKTSMGHLPILL
jgi:hypothetical protein